MYIKPAKTYRVASMARSEMHFSGHLIPEIREMLHAKKRTTEKVSAIQKWASTMKGMRKVKLFN
jgi:hypothetical protein